MCMNFITLITATNADLQVLGVNTVMFFFYFNKLFYSVEYDIDDV